MKKFAAFLSYARIDDQNNNGAITRLLELISSEVHVQTGRPFEIFQDRKDIDLGMPWGESIDNALKSTVFLIPIITPSFFASIPCRQELMRFAQREKELTRDDLILPVLFVDYPRLRNPDALKVDEALDLVARRQWFDFRDLRNKLRLGSVNSEALLEKVESLAKQICLAILRIDSNYSAIQPAGLQQGEAKLPGYRLIPPGIFAMGSDEPEARQHERPSHPVRLSKGFFMNSYPTTVGSSRHFIESTGYVTDAERKHKGTTRIWSAPGIQQDDDHPVACVSWHDAQEYCDWMSRTEGRRFRLPKEAEWEYACRAATTTKWFCGDDPACVERHAWYSINSEGAPHSAGQKRPNPYDLFDMHGNVWEWCQDWHNYYPRAPGELVDPAGPASGQYRVARGGSWRDSASHIRSPFRIRLKPAHHANNMGFRLVAEP